jgi:protoheme IX farnesyltransferase
VRATVVQICSVFKLRIAVAIMLSALAGLAVTPGSPLPAWKIAVLALAVLLSAASAGAFNQIVERDLDGRMDRTRGRPFVTGAMRPGAAWFAGIALLLAGAVAAAALALNGWAALHVFLGAFVYGVVYTVWLLFLWPTPHFWSLATALHHDYAAAQVPMLPVTVGDAAAARVILAHTVALVLVSLVPALYGLGWIYLAGALIGGGHFVFRSVRLVRDPGPATAMANFHASLLQLGLLLAAAIADSWFATWS